MICCVVLVGSLAYAEPGDFKPGSEPDGFRGIKWGQDISTIGGLIYSHTASGLDYYAREGDELEIKGIPTFSMYVFVENKFVGGVIFVVGNANWEIFKTAVLEKFGEGEQGKYSWEGKNLTTQYSWEGEKTTMGLVYDETQELGTFVVFSQKEMLKHLPELWEELKKGW